MRIMAVDHGDVRTGVAISDSMEMLASPVKTIKETDQERLADEIAAIAKEYSAEMFVVGLPVNMDGTHGYAAENCEAFAKLLSEKTGLEAALWDERRTTVTAHEILNRVNVRGKQRKAVVDTVAATVILEGYMDYRRKHK
jgi:putative Holliday junction resolvase